MDINDVIVKYVGGFGRYQKAVCFLLGMLGFFLAFYAYDIVFAAAIPDHWCSAPDLTNTKFYNLSDDEIKMLTVPREEKDGELVFSSCQMYSVNFSDLDLEYHHLANSSNGEFPIKKCQKWTYDLSTFETTAVTEVNQMLITYCAAKNYGRSLTRNV